MTAEVVLGLWWLATAVCLGNSHARSTDRVDSGEPGSADMIDIDGQVSYSGF